MFEESFPRKELVARLNVETIQIPRSILRMLFPGTPQKVIDSNKKTVAQSLDSFEADLLVLQKSEFGKKNILLIQELKEAWIRYKKRVQDVTKLFFTDNVDLKKEAEEIVSSELSPLRQKVSDLIEQISKQEKAEFTEQIEDLKSESSVKIKVAFVFALMGMGLLFVITYLINRQALKILSSINEDLKKETLVVTDSAQQISESAIRISTASTQQASSLQETSASVEEISSMVERNSENAAKSSRLSNQARESVEDGKVMVTEMLKSMEEITSGNNQ